MKLEVGMYVRTYGGKIFKIINAKQIKISYEMCIEGYDGKTSIYFGINNIKKTSHNIIDLIEVGDYVNGELVSDITGEYCRIGDTASNKFYLSNNIKTILTKEQYDNNCYKIGD